MRPLTAAQLAAARARGAIYRARRRRNSDIRWDGHSGWDGVVLGMLVKRKYLTEADANANVPAKINAALTLNNFHEAYKEAPERIPKCVLELLPKN